MVLFNLIVIVLLAVTLIVTLSKVFKAVDELYELYDRVADCLNKISENMSARAEWSHSATEFLKELSKQDSQIIESLTNIKSLINGYQEDNIIKFDNLSSKQKKFNESITELITTNSHAIMEKLNTIPTAEDMYDEVTSQTAEITEAIKATKKTTKAKTAKA